VRSEHTQEGRIRGGSEDWHGYEEGWRLPTVCVDASEEMSKGVRDTHSGDGRRKKKKKVVLVVV
jgi:hypothetical protein